MKTPVVALSRAFSLNGLEPVAFQAEWPDALNSTIQKVAHFFWNLISIVIFPILIARGLFVLLQDQIFRRAVMPGAPDYTWPKAGVSMVHAGGERITLSTPDKAKLDAVFFEGKEKKAIILAFGNGVQWECCEEKVSQLRKQFPEVSFLLINPRGIGLSQGYHSSQGHALDIYTTYEYLHKNKKIDLDNILLIGHSLGAAYGSMGAALVQQQYPNAKISMIHNRSFSTLTKEVAAFLSKLLSFLIWPLGIEMDSQTAFEKLKGKRCVIYAREDHLIPYEASLHKGLKDAHRSKHCDVIEMNSSKWIDNHNRDFNPKEAIDFTQKVEKYLHLPKRNLNWDEVIQDQDEIRPPS
ncbi:MAG TPA: hypothetical protein VLF61_04585 [Rhabdochlamydiaceae bacterium]|nr:hypothetical protein [Rhabdochlamydiaceae bacterium]